MPLAASPSEAPTLLLMGNIPGDLVLRVPRLPAAGEEVDSDTAQLFAGGGYNVLYAAAMAGLAGRYAGSHGTGWIGDHVRSALADIGCEVLQPKRDHLDSSMVIALVEPGGERSFISPRNDGVPLRADDLARVKHSSADVIYVSGYSFTGPHSTHLNDWVAALPSHSLVFCDVGPHLTAIDALELKAVLGRIDWLSCNEREARQLTGASDLVEAADLLRRSYPNAGLLLRVGPKGCWLGLPGEALQLIPAPHVDRVVDTNGAGDTHAGTFLAAIARGDSPADAVASANVAAASSVTRSGPATAPRGPHAIGPRE